MITLDWKKLYSLRMLSVGMTAVVASAGSAAFAQSYTYLPESFEEKVWNAASSSVTSSTGKWTTNKNVSSTDQAQEGSKSLFFSAKAGLTTPELPEGAGTLIYYAWDNNRQVNVETSRDGSTWTNVESYKDKNSAWTKHTVTINDAGVRYVRISTTSNKQFYIDNFLLTKPDGTTGDGEQTVTNLRLPYFVNDFETRTNFPGSKEEAASEKTYNVEGEGEWKFLNAYKGTNASYIQDGSATDLRMLKNGSYVITPLLTQGVTALSFDEGRTGKDLTVYGSKDGGENWVLLQELTTDSKNEVGVNDKEINRIKIANESKSDADLDNLIVYAFPMGTVPSVTTGSATNITSSSADVTGELSSEGDKKVFETGFCWSVDKEPTVASNVVKNSDKGNLSATLKGLPAATKILYRAYAISLAGVGYGSTLSFTTGDAQMAQVVTEEPVADSELSDETVIRVRAGGRIADNGGAEVTEAGICYSQSPAAENGTKVKGNLNKADGTFSCILELMPSTTWYVRGYAVNSVGISYGNEIVYTTPAAEIKNYAHNVYYCAPDGDDATADGSEQHPFGDLQLAVDRVVPGDTIYMKAGTYKYGKRINIGTIGEKNSGMIALFAKGGRAILDFSQMPLADANQGIRLTGSYWHLYGIDLCGAGDNGLLIERNKPTGGNYSDIAVNTEQAHHNLIENCTFYRNRDTGLQMKNLASYNYVVNCDAYFNADPDMGDADGFAVKISHGDGNYFYGCRAWNNSDDGWDQFIKKEGGFPDDITTTLENCWAFNNGYLENGTAGKGNGNGFKMGSDQGRNNVIMNRCLAFENLQKGFDQNHNTGNMILNNCTGYSAKDDSSKSHYTYRLDEPVAAGHEIRLTNCVAISDGITDRKKSAYALCSVSGTIVTSDLMTSPEDFVSIDPTGTDGARSADGELPDLDFMKIREGNDKLIDKGSEVLPYAGESPLSIGIKFNGTAPDLGCFETDNSSAVNGIAADIAASNSLSVMKTNGGLLILTVEGASSNDEFALNVYTLTGERILTKTFRGPNTMIEMPVCNGVAILNISGENYNESIKLMRKN